MTLKALVPLASVRSVPASIAFYRQLGFEVGNTHTPEGGTEPVWAWLRSGQAQIMLAQASHPIGAEEKQAVLFYLYSTDVAAFREGLLAAGVEAGEVTRPFYAPGGEFRVTDPDGYVLMVTHT